MRTIEEYPLLGTRINRMTADDLLTTVETATRTGQQCVFGNHNLHSLYLYHRDDKMQRFYEQARYVFVDGMPVVWMARALGQPLQKEHRNTPVDWVPQLLRKAAEEGWRVFFLGSAPEVAQKGRESLRDRFPGLQIETEHGYFDAAPGSREAEAVVARIRRFQPDILLVGMGMPRQEHWIVDYGAHTGANVILNVGALMELLTGTLSTPPRWVGRAGLEWLYRLVSKPDRVWRRYLWEPWFLLPRFAAELATQRLNTAGNGR